MPKRTWPESKWRMWATILSSSALFCLTPAAGAGHEPGPPDGIGVAENLGGRIPLDLSCLDDTGKAVRLGDLLDRPVILSLIYYSCEHVCPQVLVGLGRIVSELDLEAGKDYRLISFSFDPADTPAEAAAARKNYARPLGPDLPAGAWTFLTAGEPEIARLTQAVGFSFKNDGHGFIHPAVLVYLSPGGKISSYDRVSKFNYGVAYPVTFSALRTAEALRAAGRGSITAGPTAPLLFCFPHEPPGLGGYFSLMSLLGSATLLGLAALFIYLSTSRRKPKGTK